MAGRSSDSAENKIWQKTSDQGQFLVDLITPDSHIGLSEFQTWQLVIRDTGSNLGVSPVRVVVAGGMPAHGHGLPTQPQVTDHLGDGRYQLEGLMFNMAGSWQLIFEITTSEHSDRIVFDLMIDH